MCNTCSKKCALPLPEPLGFDYPELNTRFHFFTLPDNVDGNDTVHMMQRDTTLYDIQHMDANKLEHHKENRRKKADWRRMQRIRAKANVLI